MSLYFLFLFTCGTLTVSGVRKPSDTLLTCYICVEFDFTTTQKCESEKSPIQTCRFTKDLLNWSDVAHKRDPEVKFKCLLLHYKDQKDHKVKIFRACVGEFKGYEVCKKATTALKYEGKLTCQVCNTSNCNFGGRRVENASRRHSMRINVIFLALLVLSLIK